ncbi:metallophosphoesterase family protein [Streptomyces antnestii]|uniref:metallophosphoesterase family protein n=1 Tax=Streptomyces antnestii TaxID=2494256 RepID=UPI001CB9C21D|nr:metallophosphoesterase family protein [Streptomyces sp. San01]
MVEGSMTQGAGQGPEVRTATLRDFRVPAYVHDVPAYVQEPGPDLEAPVLSAPVQASSDPRRKDASYEDGPYPEPSYAEPSYAEPSYAEPSFAESSFAEPAAQVPMTDEPEGYTPTQRDLPVIKRGDTVQVQLDTEPAPRPGGDPAGPGPLYVVGDVHGYLDELTTALHEKGLIDAEGNWSAGTARLWFLGDFTDRGPDGIGVIDLVMRLSAEAAAAGGYCKALMGNHELLLLGAKRFGDTPVNSGAGTATFQAAWLLNGGQKSDMDRLQDVHLQWMSRLDAIELEDDHLLMHSDTTTYLDYGDSIEAVNDTVRETLTRNDADECWDLFRKFTKRFAFRDESGPDAVRELLGTYGGTRVVHGHSPIPYLLGEVGTEDAADGSEDSRPLVEGPHLYAGGLALAMDGGVTMAGKLLVQQLPMDS